MQHSFSSQTPARVRSRRQSGIVRLLHRVAQYRVGGGPRVPQLGREGAAESLRKRPQQGRADAVIVMRLDSIALMAMDELSNIAADRVKPAERSDDHRDRAD